MTLVEQLRHAAKLQKAHLEHLVLIFKPETLLRWHREFVRRKWTFVNIPKSPGRPSTDPHLVQVILRLAHENQWGDERITWELKKFG